MRYFDRAIIELEDSEGNVTEFEVEFKIEPTEYEGPFIFNHGGFVFEPLVFTSNCFFEGEKRKKGDELKKFDEDLVYDLLIDLGYEIPKQCYA